MKGQIKMILVLGDIHGEWGRLNDIINKKKPNIVLQVGDFGYWPSLFPNIENIKNGGCKIYWCDGNHEDHWALRSLENSEILPNVFYMKRGSTLTLPDGRVVMFMGGAESIDKASRMIGRDWFPEEIITQSDITGLPDIKIDIVISHTCPTEFDLKIGNPWLQEKFKDPSRLALSYILHKYRPDWWYFGHFHVWREGKYDNCNWTCLHYAGNTNWWVLLK